MGGDEGRHDVGRPLAHQVCGANRERHIVAARHLVCGEGSADGGIQDKESVPLVAVRASLGGIGHWRLLLVLQEKAIVLNIHIILFLVCRVLQS